ncbi:MAG TPA: hypothetical protein VHD32_12040 [Candidatus Didemnitutus sp.]|nr:hypothetical protein [Candidatus Didemnitutus sp.]
MKPPPANAIVNQLVAHTLGLFVFGGSLGLGAVWMRQEIFSTANRNRTLEMKIADADRRLDEISAEVATAMNPESLLTRNTSLRLALAAPKEPQVMRVNESPELRLSAKHNREIFSVNRSDERPESVSFQIVPASFR